MDDELLRELIRGQKEQTELLRKHLGRLRFSMRALLLLMTATACGLGYVAYVQRSNNTTPTTVSPYVYTWPSGTINVSGGVTTPRSTNPR